MTQVQYRLQYLMKKEREKWEEGKEKSRKEKDRRDISLISVLGRHRQVNECLRPTRSTQKFLASQYYRMGHCWEKIT